MRVVIVGAGIAGLSLALALRARGHESVVLEKSPHLRDEGYMLDFFGPGYDAAEKLGLIEDLERIHYPIARLAFLNRTGHERFSLPYRSLRLRLFRNRHFNLTRGALERVLYDRIAGVVEVRFATTVLSLDDARNRVRVMLSDGSTLEPDLLVGADGIHSAVRSLAFGPEEQFARRLGFQAAAYVVPHRIEGAGDKVLSTLSNPGRQVAVYPIRGGRTAAFFVHRASPSEDRLLSARSELDEAFRGMGWIVPLLLDAAPDPPDLYFDEVAQVELPAWSRGRIALVGDACQAVSLLAGQGASMAVAAALVLAEELNANHDASAALSAYERRVRPVIARKQAAGRNIARWLVPQDRLHLVVRDVAMRMSGWPVASALVRRSLDSADIPGL